MHEQHLDSKGLRATKEAAKAARGITKVLTPLEAQEEMERFERVQRIIDSLPERLRNAAELGLDSVPLIRLDDSARNCGLRGFVARVASFGLATPNPHGKQDLGSPAYHRLWDHLVAQGLEPFISNHYASDLDVSWKEAQLCVRI
jgi:hypothetical protein